MFGPRESAPAPPPSLSGRVDVEGAAGPIEMGAGLEHFLSAWEPTDTGVRFVFAGARGAVGPGPLLRFERGAAVLGLSEIVLNDGAVQVELDPGPLAGARPMDFVLYPNFPNPFNPGTNIGFFLAEAAPVRLQVFDLAGQQVRTLVSSQLPGGGHKVFWDGRDAAGSLVSSGVYFVRLEVGRARQVRRMTLLK